MVGSAALAGYVLHQMTQGNEVSAEQSAKDFEDSLVALPPGERVAKVKEKVDAVAKGQDWSKNGNLSKKNNRPIYTDKAGNHYSPDTQHGHIEKFNHRGKHQGSTDVDLKPNKPADPSGGHDIEI